MDMDIGRRLRELHEDYIVLVNLAVEEGRECDIDALVASYPDEAARLLTEASVKPSWTAPPG
ncbi:hypothetical protein ACTXG6_15820 [Pseudonocardia sp. Cha107L01]|jgi:hypothetical protein|uniref:hypothetical protein n=1 Tax=Pseudonocardia sp. Cha107L01 TaxID=3457576 RepID=UPI00403E75BE